MLASRCRGRDGARQLRRLVQTRIENPLASFLLGSSRRPSRVKARLEEEEISFCS